MKLKTANGLGKYKDCDAKCDVVNYILRKDKTSEEYSGVSQNVDEFNVVDSMNEVSEKFGKTKGVQLRHMIMSFSQEELSDVDSVNEIGKKVMNKIGEEYQTVYAVHTDKPHLHIHLVFNSVSHIDGHRYYGTKKEFGKFKTTVKKIVREHGINSVEYVSNKK